ncbi:MAG: alpha-hydroxy-acid oxidizing protein [Gemmatimonadaceae bacterium]|nr:alpha-hydroxy-acid oxidizing protein [Gemmatimonadaceae bacterium]
MLNLFEYERAAREQTDAAAWGYLVGGANDEITVGDNRRAWDEIAVRYRTMVDVTTRSLATTVLGTPVSLPVLIAPTAMQKLVHPDGELGMARAAALAETLMIVSTTATIGLADVAAATSAPKWFQVYIYQSRTYTQRLVERAVEAGYRALVLTVDAPMLGRRERDIRNAFTLPSGLHIANAEIAGMEAVPSATGDASGLMQHFRGLHDPSLTPRDIAWLREISGLPVVVKGIVRGDDAARAIDHGAAGIIVSNHGGRQLDTAIATARALPEVVAAANGRAEVYVDGGIRRGTDVLKAIALGARAVLLGRPPVWGLAVGGAEGARRVLDLLRKELDLAMALAGCRTLDEITPDLIAR